MNYCNCSGNCKANGCCQPETCGTYVTIQGPVGPMGPEGPRGEQGIQGPKGEKGDPGEKGEHGIQGEKGETGEQGSQGEKGDPGERGKQGIQGEKGDPGETPEITVAEDTPLGYRLNFSTSGQTLTTPNLRAPFEAYYADLSKTGSTLTVPLKDLVLTYQTTSASALRINIAPKTAGTSVLVDIRRITIYNSTTTETQTMDNTTVSASTSLDGTVYTNSQESHSMKIRQQDPETKLWSLCEVHSFLSAGGARSSVRVEWSEYNVAYEAPTV